ncbi:MAG: SPOR domain-containing protein [Bacteroidales bacterium]|nr:SPOR domain-containing protein [Bacteroidales bacterium]
MDKYIATLLEHNLRVIIPDLGAFILKQKEPKVVVFNESLKYDDGLLIDYMMKCENIDRGIAQQQLSDFLTGVGKALESKNVFTIEGLGSLRKDFNGRIIFAARDGNGKPGLADIITEEPVIQLEDEPAPEKPVIKKTAPEKTEKVAAPVEKKEQEQLSNKAVREVREPVKQVVEPEIKKEPPVEANAGNTVRSNGGYYSSKQVIRWLLIILLVNSAVIAFFIFRGKSPLPDVKSEQPSFFVSDSLFNQLSDSVRMAVADTSLMFAEISGAVASDSLNNEDLRYYIVAGCFRDEINADELVKSLNDVGFKAEKFGRIGNLFAVSFASFDDKDLAVKELQRIREEIHPEAWMTRF